MNTIRWFLHTVFCFRSFPGYTYPALALFESMAEKKFPVECCGCGYIARLRGRDIAAMVAEDTAEEGVGNEYGS